MMKITMTIIAMGMLLSLGSAGAFAAGKVPVRVESGTPTEAYVQAEEQEAAEETQEASAPQESAAEVEAPYSYMIGQQRSQSRNEIYAQAESIESEEEREEFLNAQGIGETEWSEDAAAAYSYVGGQQRGASYRTDDTDDNANADMSAYGYVSGQQRGASYHR